MPTARLPRPAAFWTVAVLLVLVLAASGVPSPLYRVYQEQFGFGPGVLTLVFGIYAFALLAALLVVGGLSDHVGRRPVLAGGLLLQAVAMVVFLAADGVGWLLAARVLQGLSTGALTGSLGATLLDLQRGERPLGALVNSVSPGLGLSLGAVGAGLAIEGLAEPTPWVFGVLTVVFVLGAAVVPALPESSPRLPGALASLRPQVEVPRPQRRAFLVAVPCLVALWAMGGLVLSLGPSLTAAVFGITDHLVGSLLILCMQGAGAAGGLLARNLAPRSAMAGGCLVFAVAVGALLVSLVTGATWLFFASAAVSGLGFGAAFLGAVATVTAGVAPGRRAGLLSSVFVVGYLAFSIPAIAAGIASASVGLELAAEVYGVVVILLAVGAAVGLRVSGRRAPATEPAEEPAEPLAA
ncbi:Predicted arabinose efflux permease, MFS family [Geodermatophilus dictyosporus]|uniref:Predicted arabinose efflux permease, MFS family n=1 Tax=Geodermatophilus dictyosporus TaxID=1523247 RepID=A0A1I5N6V0_9ACTN|nr:MFS transporter [Geodermatophilus dictyosporus]SFP17440.1 Predicted arabinose efflux permease, MFS family [Geodermatophilus dictyosporus]